MTANGRLQPHRLCAIERLLSSYNELLLVTQSGRSLYG